MANIKEEFEEFATCLCMIIDATSLFVVSLIVVGLMIAVMTIFSALPLYIFESLLVATNGKLKEFQFRKLLNCYYMYHNCVGKNLQFLLTAVHFFSV